MLNVTYSAIVDGLDEAGRAAFDAVLAGETPGGVAARKLAAPAAKSENVSELMSAFQMPRRR